MSWFGTRCSERVDSSVRSSGPGRHDRRVGPACAVLLLGAASCQCPSPALLDGGPAGDDAGVLRSELEPFGFCRQLAEARCGWSTRCEGIADAPHLEACRARALGPCVRLALAQDAGWRGFDADAGQRCLELTASGACGPSAAIVERCVEVFPPRGEAGSECVPGDCAPGFGCVVETSTCARCQPLRALGESCLERSCAPPWTCEGGLCRGLAHEGEACDANVRCEGACLAGRCRFAHESDDCSTTPCAAGLWCKQARCVSPRARGDSCGADVECGLAARCALDTRRCVSVPGLEGESCAGAVSCAFGLACVGDVCRSLTCTDDAACAGGLCASTGRCFSSSAPQPTGARCNGAVRCEPQLACAGNPGDERCVEPRLLAEACDVEHPCTEGTQCVGGRCVTRALLGQSCDGVACQDPLQCQGSSLTCQGLVGLGQPCTGAGFECELSFCDASLRRCVPPLANGAACTSALQCFSGRCVQGRCGSGCG